MRVGGRAAGSRPSSKSRQLRFFAKRAIDVTTAAMVLLLSSPILLVASLATFLRLGRPILFRQERIGRRGKVFVLLKIRTMSNEKDSSGAHLPDDRRLTRLGRLLRATSVDELPQMLNVLKGDMALVGPRPLLPEYRPLYNRAQWRRHEVRPGLTGLAVVAGRNLLSWDERFKLDVEYVDSWSLALDFKILFRTVMLLLSRRGINQPGHVTTGRFTGNTIDDE